VCEASLLWQAAGQAVVRRGHEFTAPELSSTLWSLATLGAVEADGHKEAFAAAARRLTGCLGELDAYALSNTLWAFAAAGASDLDLLEVRRGCDAAGAWRTVCLGT
jgi:hypothetical protein